MKVGKLMSVESKARLYGKREFVGILNDLTYSVLKNRKYMNMIDSDFKTNIMLAVTEVNGCQACSYFHTKQAIDSGISNEELESLLSGSHINVKPEQAKALMFAQHFASEKENYSEETYKVVEEYYGEEKTKGILTACKAISFGNAHGINLGNFSSRFKKSGRVKGSKLVNEVFIILSPFVLMPVLLIINLFKK